MKAMVIEMGRKHFLRKMRAYNWWFDKKRKNKPGEFGYGNKVTSVKGTSVKDVE